MKLFFALLTVTLASEQDETSLLQGADPWIDGVKSREDVQDGLSHENQVAAKNAMLKFNNGMTLAMSRVHEKLDKAHTVIADKRAALDKDLAAAADTKARAMLMDAYLTDTLPTWTNMVDTGSKPLQRAITYVHTRYQRPAVREFMEVANRSLVNAADFVEEMKDVQGRWHLITKRDMSDKQALDVVQGVQAKAEKGLKVFKDSEREFTNGWVKFSASLNRFGTALGAETDTLIALRTVTGNIHDECIMVGSKGLRAFTELVGGMDDGEASLARSIKMH